MPASAGMEYKKCKEQQGFTLIEILIALLVFAIVAVLATVGLSAVLKARERSNVQVQTMQQMQLAFLIMKQDINQMVARPVIDNTGNQIPALVEHAHYIEFTRAGYVNPLMQLKRSTLQRVAYIFHQQQLIRRTWPVLDRAPETQPSDRVLLTHLQNINFAFLADNKQFTQIWPATTVTAGQNTNTQIPKGIKIDFTFNKLGTLTYLFLVPATGSN
jgi:general secretion pathway protein J